MRTCLWEGELFTCIIPDSAVLTLREEKPSADSCGDPSLERLLPEKCGAEAVFNFSWEKEIEEYGSGVDEDEDEDGGGGGDGHEWTTTVGTTVLFTRTLLSTNRTTRSTVEVAVGSLNRTVTRLLPRFTPSLETRYSSFQQLLRLHMNTFNQRLSMLERNTLDIKESIQGMEDQQKHLSSQLDKLIALHSAGEKDSKVKELENSYSDMETRLSRLEGRLEILIDGFTALAQEMNRMKRARHSSRSAQERLALPSITTVLPLLLSQTPRPPVTQRPLTRVATVQKGIPTPALRRNRPSSAAITRSTGTSTQLRPISKSSRSQDPTRFGIRSKSTLRAPRTHGASAKPSATSQGARAATEVRKGAGVTRFQLEPPSHKPQAAKPDRTSGNRRKKTFRSDAPALKNTSENVSEGEFKKSVEQRHNSGRKIFTTTQPVTVAPATAPTAGSRNSAPPKARTPAAATRPTTAGKHRSTSSKSRKASTAKRSKSTPPKTRARTVMRNSASTARRKPAPSRSEANRRAAKRPQRPSVLDLLQLLKGDHKPAKQKKTHDSSLHVVLGRLAIPIKIIPDY